MRNQMTPISYILAAIVVGGLTACGIPSGSTAGDRSSVSSSNAPQVSDSQSAHKNRARYGIRKKIEAVLTAEQLQEFRTKLKQGEKARKALSEINLSDDQKAKIQEIFKDSHRTVSSAKAT